MKKTETISSEIFNKKQEKNNPANAVDKEYASVQPSLETDKFTSEEQKEISEMVYKDAKADIESMDVWLQDRRLDIMLYEGDRPTKIEGLQKKDWQLENYGNDRSAKPILEIHVASILDDAVLATHDVYS